MSVKDVTTSVRGVMMSAPREMGRRVRMTTNVRKVRRKKSLKIMKRKIILKKKPARRVEKFSELKNSWTKPNPKRQQL